MPQRVQLVYGLDDFYACACGLTRRAALHPRPRPREGPDYLSGAFRVLKEKEIRQHGEYRTRRLVLEACDRMEADGEFTVMDI